MTTTSDKSRTPFIKNVASYLDLSKSVQEGDSPARLSFSERERMLATRNRLVVIYFVAAVDAGVIKIGKTKNFSKCLTALSSVSPVQLSPIFAIQYDDTMHARITKHLEAHRSHGEWFFADRPVLEFVESVYRNGVPWLVATVGDSKNIH